MWLSGWICVWSRGIGGSVGANRDSFDISCARCVCVVFFLLLIRLCPPTSSCCRAQTTKTRKKSSTQGSQALFPPRASSFFSARAHCLTLAQYHHSSARRDKSIRRTWAYVLQIKIAIVCDLSGQCDWEWSRPGVGRRCVVGVGCSIANVCQYVCARLRFAPCYVLSCARLGFRSLCISRTKVERY